jgi:hypothetical protein
MDIQTRELLVSARSKGNVVRKARARELASFYSNVGACLSGARNFEWFMIRRAVFLRPLHDSGTDMYVNTDGPKANGTFGSVWIFRNTRLMHIQIAVKTFKSDNDAELRVYDALSTHCANSRVQGCRATIHIKRDGYQPVTKPIVIMEFALYTLEHYITKLHSGTPWDINTIKKTLSMVADAVLCIQQTTGMWYTDLKLENILVVQEDPLKVILGDIGSLCIDGERCSYTFSDQYLDEHMATPTPERYAIIGMMYVAKCIILRRTSGGVNQAYDSEEMNAQMFDKDRNREEIETYRTNVLKLPAGIMDCNNFVEIYDLIEALH